MKNLVSFALVSMLTVALCVLPGCVRLLQTTKPTAEKAASQSQDTISPSDDDNPTEEALRKPTAAGAGEPEESPTPPSSPAPPVSTPPPPPPEEGDASPSIDPQEADAVNRAALVFAKNIKGVQHIKTCYSKLYGGWYLLLYVQQGKNISLQQYSWNPKSREWEVIYQLKELPKDQVKFHFEDEVGDEKCYQLMWDGKPL